MVEVARHRTERLLGLTKKPRLEDKEKIFQSDCSDECYPLSYFIVLYKNIIRILPEQCLRRE